jgi:methylmalonyl-CoA/ethylmalonyl-CoA epimerase
LTVKIHHVGYVVKSVYAAADKFKSLGYREFSAVTYDKTRDVHICFLRNGDVTVELVAPASKHSVVYNLWKKYKTSPYHICYESADFEIDIASLLAQGFILLQNPLPAPALEDRRAAFLFHNDAGLIEVLENSVR